MRLNGGNGSGQRDSYSGRSRTGRNELHRMAQEGAEHFAASPCDKNIVLFLKLPGWRQTSSWQGGSRPARKSLVEKVLCLGAALGSC